MKAPFPLVEFSGIAYDCARQFALWSVEHFPDYQDYGRMLVEESRNAPAEYLDICRREAPFLLEFFRAFNEIFGSSQRESAPGTPPSRGGADSPAPCTGRSGPGLHEICQQRYPHHHPTG